MNPYHFTIALTLSFLSYFLVNLVMCTFCMIPGCGFVCVIISFFVLVFTWAYLLLTDVK